MPGYAALLAPITAFKPASFVPYQILSIGMVLLWLWTLWKLLEGECSSDVRWAVWSLTALNPLTAGLSGTVLSDIPFALGAAFFFYALKAWWPLDRPLHGVIVAGLAVLLFEIRPVGGLAILALLGTLAMSRRWKPLGMMAAIAAFFILPYFLRNYLLRGYLHPLAGFWTWSSVSTLGETMIENLRYYGNEIFVRLFFRWPDHPFHALSTVVTVGASTFLVIRGALEIRWSGWKRTVGFFLLGYVLVHLTWAAQTPRYFLPLLPFILWCFFQGLEAIVRSLKPRLPALPAGRQAARQLRWALAGMVGLSLLLSARPLGRMVQSSIYQPNVLNTPPERSYAWVRTQTDPKAIFLAQQDGRFYLYTGRQCWIPPELDSTAGLGAWLMSRSVQYVFLEPEDYLLSAAAGVYRPIPGAILERWLAEQKGSRLVFEDGQERTRIYDISGLYNFSRPKKRSVF